MIDRLYRHVKEYKKEAVRIAILFITIPLIVYCLSEIPFLPVGGTNDWAGFWGSYLGGWVAIIGVGWTIYDSKHSDIRPDLLFDEIQSDDLPQNAQGACLLCDLQGNVVQELYFKIRNVGRGIAKNIIISSNKNPNTAKIRVIENDKDCNIQYVCIRTAFNAPDILRAGEKEKILEFTKQSHIEKIMVYYEDLLGKKYQRQLLIEYQCVTQPDKKDGLLKPFFQKTWELRQ